MRIQESCVSSEDIKIATGAKSILYMQSIGYKPWLMDKRGHEIGEIKTVGPVYLGDDIVIKEIIIFKDKELSKKLTEKYKSKILIMSLLKDQWW